MADGKLLFRFLLSLLVFSRFPTENAAQNGDGQNAESEEAKKEDIVPPQQKVLLSPQSETPSVDSSEGSKKAQEKQEDGDAAKKVEAKTDENDAKEVEEDKKEDKQVEEKDEQKSEKKEVGMDLKLLDDDNFEHLTQASSGATTGDWLVLFTKKDCEQCNEMENAMKIVYGRIKHKLNVAKVEQNSMSKLTFKRFHVNIFPSIFLFHHGKMIMYGREKNVDDILKFATEDFKLAPWSSINKPYSNIDWMVEEATNELRHMINYKKLVSAIIFLVGILVGIFLTTICGSLLFYLTENFKDEDDDISQSCEIKNKSE